MRILLLIVFACNWVQAAPTLEQRIVRLLGQPVEIRTKAGERAAGQLIWLNSEFLTVRQGGQCHEVDLATVEGIESTVRIEPGERVGGILGGLAMGAVLVPVLIIAKVVDVRPILAGRWESVNPVRPRFYSSLEFRSDGSMIESTEVVTEGRYGFDGDTVRLEFDGEKTEAPAAFHCGTLVMRGEEFRRQSAPSIREPAIAGMWCRDSDKAEVCFHFASGGTFVKRTRLDSKRGTYRRRSGGIEIEWATGGAAEQRKLRFDKDKLVISAAGAATRYRKLP